MSEAQLIPFSGDDEYNGFFCGNAEGDVEAVQWHPAFLEAASESGTVSTLTVDSNTPAIMGMVTLPDGGIPTNLGFAITAPDGTKVGSSTPSDAAPNVFQLSPDSNGLFYFFVITDLTVGDWTLSLFGDTDQEFVAMAQTLPDLAADVADVDVMNATLEQLFQDEAMGEMMAATELSVGCRFCLIGAAVIAAGVVAILLTVGITITVPLLATSAIGIALLAWAGLAGELIIEALVGLTSPTIHNVLNTMCAGVGACSSSSS